MLSARSGFRRHCAHTLRLSSSSSASSTSPPHPRVTDSFENALRSILGAGDDALARSAVSSNATTRDQHGDDESHHPCVPPDLVAFARSTSEVAEVVKLCAEHRVPLVPYGSGTSLEGHVQAVEGGVCLDLSLMNAVLATNEEDMDCRVEAGVTRRALNDHLRHTGLQMMVDPGADASLGGMAACGASGTSAVRYGTMRDNVLGLTAVLPSGEVVEVGGRARKSSAGYDLRGLLVGSEGTLGVITEVGIRLHPVLTSISAATCNFPSLHDAASAVVAIQQMGIPLARCELLDAATIRCFNEYAGDVEDMPLAPTLFLEFAAASDAGACVLVCPGCVCTRCDMCRCEYAPLLFRPSPVAT